MGLFDFITGKHMDEQTEEEQAEQYLESEGDGVSPLVRGYVIEEVTDHIEDATGLHLSDEQTTRIVSKLRRKHGVRPLQEWEQAGYIDPSEYPEDQAAMRARSEERNEVRGRGENYVEYLSKRGRLFGQNR